MVGHHRVTVTKQPDEFAKAMEEIQNKLSASWSNSCRHNDDLSGIGSSGLVVRCLKHLRGIVSTYVVQPDV